MIKSFRIEKLFGIYDYTIQLKGSNTIIYGPNGCGKTTILKMIYYLFQGKISQLSQIDFESLEVIYCNNDSLKVIKNPEISVKLKSKIAVDKTPGNLQISYELTKNGIKETYDYKEQIKLFLKSISAVKESGNIYRHILPFAERRADDEWFAFRDEKMMNTSDFIDVYYDYIIASMTPKSLSQIDIPKEIKEFTGIVDVQLIAADRLMVEKTEKRTPYGEETTKLESKVTIYAHEIAEKMKTALQEYGSFSQTKDRSFPVRVIEDSNVLSVSEIKQKLINLEEKRKHYIYIGILEPENQEILIDKLISSVTEETRRTLSLYAKDTELKLNVLDEFSSSVSLFKELLDKKFENKEIVLNKENGFTFRLVHNGKKLDATKLSSGEQQELVLLYDLIFRTNTHTLVLIDEPELSLHIKWQLEFLDDLTKIIRKCGFKTLIATHSPQIIDDRWDLTSSLGEGR